MKYTVILEKGRESGYVAQVLALRGCMSQGAEARRPFAQVVVPAHRSWHTRTLAGILDGPRISTGDFEKLL